MAFPASNFVGTHIRRSKPNIKQDDTRRFSSEEECRIMQRYLEQNCERSSPYGDYPQPKPKHIPLVEVVCTAVLVEGSTLEHVIADGQNGVGDPDNRSLGSACAGKTAARIVRLRHTHFHAWL